MDQTVESFWTGPVWNIPGTPWDIVGYSRACYRTGFYIRHLDLMIDAGPQKSGNPKTILITHCHGDHIANIPFTLIPLDEIQKKTKTTVFVHEKSAKRLSNYITAMFSANYSTDYKGHVADFKGITGGMKFDYVANNTKLSIEVFACTHDVPTVAYGISTKKQLLKEEFFELKGNNKAIVELKKKGIEITDTVYEPNIAFVWDTTIQVLKNNPGILNYPVIMIECTFLYEDDYELSISKKHIHWNSLKPYVVRNPDKYFVLVHFSLRYTEPEIIAFFKKENLKNVKPWLQSS
jgi:ribonuclease Z